MCDTDIRTTPVAGWPFGSVVDLLSTIKARTVFSALVEMAMAMIVAFASGGNFREVVDVRKSNCLILLLPCTLMHSDVVDFLFILRYVDGTLVISCGHFP